jgi:hypothetical protein
VRFYVSIGPNVAGCLILAAAALLGAILFFGWLAGMSMWHDAQKADVPGSVRTVGYVVTGPSNSHPANMPWFRTRADLEEWMSLESNANDSDGIDKVFAFEDKRRLLQLNGGEQVRVLEQDGHILRLRILPLPRGYTWDDFSVFQPHDVGQECYTFADYDLFQTE